MLCKLIVGNSLGYQAPGLGRDPSQSPKIWDHLQVTLTKNLSKYHSYKVFLDRRFQPKIYALTRILYQATYGDLVRLDLPRNPPTVLVFHPHLAEQASENSPGRAGKQRFAWENTSLVCRCTGRREVIHTGITQWMKN